MLNRSERSFYERLDHAAAEQAKDHAQELSKAAIEHERIQRSARLEIERLLLQQEQERKAREEQQRLEIERLNRERAQREAEVQQRRLEAKRKEEEEVRLAAERQRQLHEAEARVKAQKEQAEREEAIRRAQEYAAAAAAKAQAQQPTQIQRPLQQLGAPLATTSLPTTAAVGPTTRQAATDPVLEEIHSKYLKLHQRMKEFWKPFKKAQAEKGAPLKAQTGQVRRDLRTKLGQLNTDRAQSKARMSDIRDIFNTAMSHTEVMIDIRPFIISYPIPQLQDEAQAQFPALLLYAFICFTKLLIAQWELESDGRIIQEGGLVAASLFADQNYMWNGIPMTDVLIAKYHKACPMLFGIRGKMDTPQNQARLGWRNIHNTPPQVNTYNQYMWSLGCGFAALSLRQFSGKNPAIPVTAYWLAVSSICNTPADDIYGGHFMVLQGLVRDFAKKFINFYGVQARAVLRRATIDLPARAPKRAADTAKLVSVLKDGWEKNDKISLD